MIPAGRSRCTILSPLSYVNFWNISSENIYNSPSTRECLDVNPPTMDVTDISPHLDQLDGDLDKLEDVLQPLLKDLGDVASKLPLLDKAKLYVLATYSIESTLYCKVFPSIAVHSYF